MAIYASIKLLVFCKNVACKSVMRNVCKYVDRKQRWKESVCWCHMDCFRIDYRPKTTICTNNWKDVLYRLRTRRDLFSTTYVHWNRRSTYFSRLKLAQYISFVLKIGVVHIFRAEILHEFKYGRTETKTVKNMRWKRENTEIWP